MKQQLTILTLFILMIVSLINNQNALAQNPPCSTDCGGSWTTDTFPYSNYPQCPGCVINVTVSYNTTCNEYFLIGLQFTNSNCTDCLSNGNWSYADVFRETYIKLLVSGPLSPPYPNTDIITRISTTACWKSGTSPMNPWQIQPCGEEPCCKKEYKVTRNPDNTVTYSFIRNILTGTCTNPCFPICDIPFFPKIRLIEQENVGKTNTKVTTSPNPSNLVINFDVQSELIGKIEVTLIDLEGKIVLIESINKNSYQEIFNLDLNKIKTGSYLYTLKINNENFSTGKILISK
mgnify:FL=1